MGMQESSKIGTPGVRDQEGAEDDQPVSAEKQKMLRRVIAVLNYMSQDRADLGFSVKECARTMSAPTVATEKAVKRISRYLRANPRMVYSF